MNVFNVDHLSITQSLTHFYRDDDKILVLVLELLVRISFCTAVGYPALCFQFPIKVLIFGSKQPNMPLSDILRQIFALEAQLGILTLANSLRRAGALVLGHLIILFIVLAEECLVTLCNNTIQKIPVEQQFGNSRVTALEKFDIIVGWRA